MAATTNIGISKKKDGTFHFFIILMIQANGQYLSHTKQDSKNMTVDMMSFTKKDGKLKMIVY